MSVIVHKPPHGPSGAERHFLRREFEEIRRSKGISGTLIEQPWETWAHDLTGLLGDGSTHLIYIPGGWLPALSSQGMLRNLSSCMPLEIERWRALYPDSVFNIGAWSGAQFGIPAYGAVWCFMYNEQLFEEAGISSIPETWEDLKACADRLKRRFPDVIPYGINDDSDGHFIDHGYVYLFAGGRSEWTDDQGNLRFDHEWSVKGLAFLQEMVARGLANIPLDSPSHSIAEQLLDGRIGMTVGPSDWLLLQRQRYPRTRLRVAMMPCPQGGRPLSFASYGFYGLVSGGEPVTEAAEWLRELIRPERLARHIRTIGMLPVQKGMRLYDQDSAFSVFAEQVVHSGAFPTADLSFADALTPEMLACLRLKKSAAEALSGATQRIREVGGSNGSTRVD
ncbi:extracellular solute-binding protein [Paenibacillus sp. MWE-103]|uniref:Extracellular solute-binding protein n=1 Tax=Paenibacillus artemisiicola TaxID=1172618 RepID=A0ABS3W688_9BACL|nr:extracellular solute-binding protein [Paenibacillus artemisiicola]MBO7743696.1 extracellular solute-binding protein [Paenibacillus artemisiicola]